jgi:hypothetical protein
MILHLKIVVIQTGSDPLLVESFCDTIEPPSTTSTIFAERATIENCSHFWSNLKGCSLIQKCFYCCEVGSIDVIGITSTDSANNTVAVSKF